jgi:type I restriction enzyme, S subunit
MKEEFLGEICDFNYGESLREDRRKPGSVPVYGSNGIVGWHTQAVTQGPTIVIGRKGSIGEVHFSPVPCWPIDTTYYVERPKRDCDLRWLYRALIALDLTRLNKAAAVPGLNREDAYRKRVVFPSLPEQELIAAILEKADRLRSMRRYARQLSDTFLQSIFLEMFEHPLASETKWEKANVGSVAEIIVPTRDKPKAFSGDVPWITLPDLNGLFVSKAKHSLTHDEAAAVGNRLMPAQTVLLSCAGSVGRVAVTTRQIYANQQFYGLVAKANRIDPLYLAFFLLLLGEPFFFRLAGVSTLAFFSKEKAMGITLKVPPLPLQEKFTAIVRRFERLRAQQREGERQAEHLFQTLLHDAFSGES